MTMERDLVEARMRIAELEAREAHLVVREAQWVNVLTDRLQAIVRLQQQMHGEMDQLRGDRLVHLQALADMDGQLEAMDHDLEAANDLITPHGITYSFEFLCSHNDPCQGTKINSEIQGHK